MQPAIRPYFFLFGRERKKERRTLIEILGKARSQVFYSGCSKTQKLVRKPQFKVKEKTLSNSEKKFDRRAFHFKDDGES